MTMFEMRANGIAAVLDLSVGHLAAFTVESGGRLLRPLHRAPWVDRPGETMPAGTAPNVARLSGDFFCAAFSRNDVEEAPPHGWTANSEWEPAGESVIDGGRRWSFRLKRRVMGAAVEKRLVLRDGHPFLYQEHVFYGGEGSVPVAHHTMVRMEAGGLLAFSPKRAALTPDTPLETDPVRGRSLFAYPARTEDIARMPTADGGSADLTRYPPGERHEDFLTLVEADHAGPGFAMVARIAERDLVLTLRDPLLLPVTMLWYSNGGREYAPWSGRHLGVLGIEDGCSAIGHAQSLGDNPISREGVATAIALDPQGMVAVRQVIGATALDDVAAPARVEAAEGALTVSLADRREIRLPFDDGFLGGR